MENGAERAAALCLTIGKCLREKLRRLEVAAFPALVLDRDGQDAMLGLLADQIACLAEHEEAGRERFRATKVPASIRPACDLKVDEAFSDAVSGYQLFVQAFQTISEADARDIDAVQRAIKARHVRVEVDEVSIEDSGHFISGV